MPKRKLNNVTKRADGRWVARKSFGNNPDGTPNRKSFYGATAAEASQKLADFERQLENGLDVDAENLRFGQWLTTWMKEYKFGSVRDQTFDVYEGYITSRIAPALGQHKLRSLRPDHIQKFLNSLKTTENRNDQEKTGLSTATITKIKNILSGALSQAVKNGLITRNPADAITLPKTTKRKVLAFTQDEQSALLGELADHRLYALFVFALGTGLRRGELLALKWADVDMEMQEIAVRASMTRSKDRDEHGDIIEGGASQSSKKLGEVKTDSGYRVVPLTDEVKDVLVKHKKAQTEERLHAGPGWANNDLVFSNTLGGFLEPRNTTRLYESKRNAAAVRPLTFHSMRHSFATNAIAAGMDYYYLSRIMGHANISITLDTYADFMPDKSRAEMKKLEGVLLLKKA